MSKLYPDVTDEWEWLRRYSNDERVATVDVEWVRENETRLDAGDTTESSRVLASMRYLTRMASYKE